MAGEEGEFRERYLTAQDGLRLYFRDYGDPFSAVLPVLCLTGLARNSKDYHDLALHLAERRRVICPDYRGRGRSEYDPNWRNYEPTTYLNDIRHLLAALDVHSVVVVGTSLGAFLAMGMAVAMPTSVAGAILNDAGPDVNPQGLARILAYIGSDRPQPDWNAAARELRELFPGLSIDSDAGWLRFARQTYREGDDGLLHFDWDPNIARPLMRARTDLPDLWALFRALRNVPVLAFRGARSDVLSEDTFSRMAAELPHMTAVTVPGVGHAPTLDEPEVLGALDDFLEKVA